jgi:hypothetical protein
MQVDRSLVEACDIHCRGESDFLLYRLGSIGRRFVGRIDHLESVDRILQVRVELILPTEVPAARTIEWLYAE